MRKSFNLFSLMAILSITLLACGGASPGSVGIDATELPATQPLVTEPAVSILTATEAPAEIVPIDLAGPVMEVGSKYTYVDGSILVAVPGGPFVMGYENFFDSKEREVTVSDYWIYSNEVTNQQYALCVNAGKCDPPDTVDNPSFTNYRFVSYPVTGVNYQQATDYCSFVHGRLPTEAEWEKAARGEDGNLFPWGDQAPVCDLLNFNFCKGKTVDVNSYPDGVSFYGLFDMAGNVREWTADWYKPEYDTESTTDPLGPTLGDKRSVRSSSFQDSADFTFAAHRFSLRPGDHLPDLGFRCVVEDPTYYALYCEGLVLYGADINGNPTNDVIPVPDTCKQSTINIATDCKKTADNYITPNVEPGASLSIPPAPQCQAGPPTWVCSGSGTVSINPQVCNVPPPANGGTCSPGYVEQPDPNDPNKKICVGQGSSARCLPGFNYDPISKCCTAENPGPNQYGICAPGFYQVGNACIPSQSNPPQPVLVSVNFSPVALCPPTGGGCDPATDPACQPSTCAPQACTFGTWDSKLCCCFSAAKGGCQ